MTLSRDLISPAKELEIAQDSSTLTLDERSSFSGFLLSLKNSARDFLNDLDFQNLQTYRDRAAAVPDFAFKPLRVKLKEKMRPTS